MMEPRGEEGRKVPEAAEVVNITSAVPCAPMFATVMGERGDEPTVWTSSMTGAIILRKCNSCEVIAKIDGVNPSCITVVNNKVWVGRENGMISVYDYTGTFLTVLQNSNDSLPIQSMLVFEDRVYTVATSKDIIEWDASRFCVTRILFGPIPGDIVQCMAHNNSSAKFSLFSGTRGHVRIWNSDGKWEHCSEGGSTSLVYIPPQQQLWSATERGIVVFNTGHPTDPLTATRALHQGRNILQLLYLPTEGRVWSFDSQNTCTVFSTKTHTALQTLNTPTPLTGHNAFFSHKTEVAKVWVVNDEGHNIRVWESVSYLEATAPTVTDTCSVKADDDENMTAKKEAEHLKKKIKYLQSVGTIFRQRIGILFKEKFRQRDFGMGGEGADFEGMYKQALTELVNTAPDAAGLLEEGPDYQADASVESLMMENESLQLALNEALSNNAKGTAAMGGDVEKITKYWKDKLKGTSDDLQNAKQEIERLSTMLHEIGPQKDIDIKRAHHICQVLKEKNALKEREMSLQEEIEMLKKSLSQSEEKYIELKNSLGDYVWNNMQQGATTMDTMHADDSRPKGLFEIEGEGSLSKEKQYSIVVDQMREDNEKLKQELNEAQRQLRRHEDQANECQTIIKQNALLKNRIQKMKENMQNQRIDTTNSHTEMQHNMETMMTNINQLQNDLSQRDATVQELSSDKLKLMQDISRMNTILERYKTKVLSLEREQISRTKVEQVSGREHKKETSTLCESLDSREEKIRQLQANFVDISEQLQHQVQQVSRTNHELDLLSRENMSLKSKLQQLDILLDERRQFTGLLGEVQGRMEMAVEELKRAQSTTELASEMSNLEQRIAGLTALEAQLKQKDDLIAVRDDEIQKLKLRLAMFERNVNNISAVFLQFPQSLEEMEMMIIENEEFRKMAGQNAELEERVKLRQLEIQARKQQQQQQGIATSLQAGVAGSLDAATAALLARTDSDSDSDDGSLVFPRMPHPSGALPPSYPSTNQFNSSF